MCPYAEIVDLGQRKQPTTTAIKQFRSDFVLFIFFYFFFFLMPLPKIDKLRYRVPTKDITLLLKKLI